ncbi:MAG: hypothetical protein ACOCUI_03825 [bacterium]
MGFINENEIKDDEMYFTSINIPFRDYVKAVKKYGSLRRFISKKVAEEDAKCQEGSNEQSWS